MTRTFKPKAPATEKQLIAALGLTTKKAAEYRAALEAIVKDSIWAIDDCPCHGCSGKINHARAALKGASHKLGTSSR